MRFICTWPLQLLGWMRIALCNMWLRCGFNRLVPLGWSTLPSCWILDFTRCSFARSLIGFVHCSGLRVVPQLKVAPVWFATSPGLSCFFGGSSTVALCPRFGSMVVGCVLGMMKTPFVACRLLLRFLRHGVVPCLSFCGEVGLCLGCRSILLCRLSRWGLLFPFLVFRGGPGFPLGCVRIWRFSFPLSVRCSRCVYPPCGERFGGLMARNPASYVSCLTLVTRRMCESVSSDDKLDTEKAPYLRFQRKFCIIFTMNERGQKRCIEFLLGTGKARISWISRGLLIFASSVRHPLCSCWGPLLPRIWEPS